VFTYLNALDAAVVLVDEVQEIEGARSGIPADPAHGVTNELLKLIPTFRQPDQRLRICAPNSVLSLGSAHLSPRPLDYIIPAGPPEDAARKAIWNRYLGVSADYVEVDKLVEATHMFTPADIEFAARKGAQCAFEREIEQRRGEPACTDDYLGAIAETRPTLTDAMLDEFSEDIDVRTRL